MSNLVAAAFSVLLGTPALAEGSKSSAPSDLAVSWEAPRECPDAADVRRMLAAFDPSLTITDEGSTANAELLARVRVELRSPDEWAVELTIEGPVSVERRSFAAETCETAAEATALVLAMALEGEPPTDEPTAQPEPAPTEPEPDPEPAPTEPPTPPAVTPEAAPVEPDPPEANPTGARTTSTRGEGPPGRDFGFAVGVLGGGGYGPLTSGSGLVSLSLAVLGPRWRVALLGSWQPPTRVDLATGLGSARIDGFVAGARGCGVPATGRLDFPLCGGVEAGVVRGRGLAPVLSPRDAGQLYVGLEAGPGLYWRPLAYLAVGLEARLRVPLVSGGFSVGGLPAIDNAPVGFHALAALEARFE